jgi:molecular chaperone GrpE
LEDDTDIKDKDGETGLTPADAPAAEPAELEALRRERDELKDQLLRRRADFENYRKRVERDREQATLEARAEILAGLLPALDNMERALTAPGEGGTLREGIELTYRNILAFLEAQGVQVVDPTGQPFDPQQHQALLHEPAPGFADGTVVETFRKAYILKDRLLRPALVKVAKGGDAEAETKH